MLNERLTRWITSSVAKHFKTAETDSFTMYMEGQRPRALDDKTNYYELRIDGPYIVEISRGVYDVYIEVNVLISSPMQMGESVNIYSIQDSIGKVLSRFTKTIKIFKLGEQPAIDTGEVLTCLKLLQDHRKGERIQVSNFGQIDPKVRVQQATVEGHYSTEITT